MKCDVIAEGIIEAAKTLNLKLPLVVRLQGMFCFSKSLIVLITFCFTKEV